MMELEDFVLCLLSVLIAVLLTVAVTQRITRDRAADRWQVKSVVHGHAEYVPDGDRLEWRWLDHAGCGEGGE